MTIAVRYYAFIRAINTGDRRLTNASLIDPFVRLGFADVAAYQAAGNITFRTDDPDLAHPDRIGTALAEAYGFEAPVFLRSSTELRATVETVPFDEDALAGTDGRVQVSFMRDVPNGGTIAEVEALVPAGERVVFAEREWFWLPVRGVSDSRLPVAAIEGLVGPMTMRTLGTVSRMFAKFA